MAGSAAREAGHRGAAANRDGSLAAGWRAPVTGTIVQLKPGGRTGVIREEEDGTQVPFSDTEVLGDFYTLTVGQRVSFDIEITARHSHAVRVLAIPFPAGVAKRPLSPLDVRYVGFEQTGNIRRFHFESVACGQASRRYVVSVDLALLGEYHVGVQEAPALCLRKLLARLAGSPGTEPDELNEADLAEFVRLREAAAAERKARIRTPAPHRRGAPPPPPGPRFPNLR